VAYVLWFVGLIVGAIGTGSTAIIARATGARHRSLANSVCGQSVTAAVMLGIVLGTLLYLFGESLVLATELKGKAAEFALSYLRILCISLPFSTLMFAANACLRGAGDTRTPAISMMIVDVVNVIFSFGLTYGWGIFPELGFNGIAIGTVIAYIAGGLLQFAVLVHGRGGIRLHVHRLWPHWLTMKRLLRIGIPSGMESLLAWIANFAVVVVINDLDDTYTMAAAHINTIRIESISFLFGFAVATAAATMVGKSLGMRDSGRATRSAYLAYALGGGVMILLGVLFITLGRFPARWLGANEQIAELTTQCLFITGFIQCGFASAAIFGGSLRGAGDTLTVMMLNLASVLSIRLVGVLIVGKYLGMGLPAIWLVLSAELFTRGVLVYLRFLHGGWKKMRV
jgi:putative MATE family efflux protein